MTPASRALARVRRIVPDGFPWQAASWPASIERAAPERGLGVDYDTSWSRRYPVRLARAVLLDHMATPAVRALATPRVVGAEVLDGLDPPAIFVANHASHLDTALILSVLPPPMRHRTVVAAAADHFFDRRMKAHLWSFCLAAIPIERHRVNRRSAELAAGLLEEGWNLVIFPEGGRTPDGWQQEFRGGAAYLSVRTGRPMVPVHLDRTWRLLPKGGRRIRRAGVQVTFGLPILAAPGEDARRLSARVEQAVAVLGDESASDWWSARRRHAAGATPSARGPDWSSWRRAWELTSPSRDHPSRSGGAATGPPSGDLRWALTRQRKPSGA